MKRRDTECPRILTDYIEVFRLFGKDTARLEAATEKLTGEYQAATKELLTEYKAIAASLAETNIEVNVLEGFRAHNESLINEFTDRFKPILGNRLQKKLKEISSNVANEEEWWLTIPFLVQERMILQELAFHASVERDVRTRGHKWTFSLDLGTSLFTLSKDGQLRSSGLPGVIQICISESLDVSRIKICEVCDDLFWVRRKGANACSRRCSNTLAQRRFALRKVREQQRVEGESSLPQERDDSKLSEFGKPEIETYLEDFYFRSWRYQLKEED